ncbi:MAG TPA: polysaccharide biosynthesis C-terminal domain-containing protein [Bacteroidia bacterium]|nr:polysaccharide biosynthesis C-terminal domain-containing protein [Bacteroidia bacterium]
MNTVIIYVGVILGFLNTIFIQPHYLTPDEVGLARIMVSFGGFLTPFMLMGSASTCVRYFPLFKDRDKKHHGIFGLVMMIAAIGIAFGGLVIFLFRERIKAAYAGDSELFVHYFYLAFPVAVVMTLGIAVNAYCNSLLKTTFTSFMNDIWVRVLLIVTTVLYAVRFISLDQFVWSIFITYASQFAIVAMYVFVIDRPGLRVDTAFIKKIGWNKIITYSLLLAVTALSSLSMKFLDTVMIGAYLPLKFVGIYSIGAFIAQFIETPLYSLERVAGIKIAHAMQENNLKEVKDIYTKSVKYLFLIGGFLVVCIVTNIHDFLLLLPKDYRDAAGVTIIMSIGSIINMATGVNSPILNNSSRYIWGVIFMLILLVVSVILNMLFIPRFGIEGAAIATGLASVLYNFAKFIFIWKTFHMQPYDRKTILTVVVIGVSLAAGLLIPSISNVLGTLALRGTAVAITYFVLTFLFRIVPEFHSKLPSPLNRF